MWRTPPQFAKELGVDAAKVVGWCKSGELAAINVSEGDRPLFRISQQAIDEFVARRSVKPPAKLFRRRQRVAAGMKEYF